MYEVFPSYVNDIHKNLNIPKLFYLGPHSEIKDIFYEVVCGGCLVKTKCLQQIVQTHKTIIEKEDGTHCHTTGVLGALGHILRYEILVLKPCNRMILRLRNVFKGEGTFLYRGRRPYPGVEVCESYEFHKYNHNREKWKLNKYVQF